MLAAPRLLAPLGAARQGAGGAAEVVAALAVALPLVPGHLGARAVAVQRLHQRARLAACMRPVVAHVAAVVAGLATAGIHVVGCRHQGAKVTGGLAAVVGAAGVHAVSAQRPARQQARGAGGAAELQGILEAAEVLQQCRLELRRLRGVLDWLCSPVQPCRGSSPAAVQQSLHEGLKRSVEEPAHAACPYAPAHLAQTKVPHLFTHRMSLYR